MRHATLIEGHPVGSPVQPPRREEGLSRRHFSPGAGPRSGPGITGRSADKRLANLVQREALVLTPALENAHRPIEQLLLPVVDLVRMNPERARQLGDCSIASD